MKNTERDTIANRLAMILMKLLDGQSLSIAELAEEFSVDERTIYRDLKERLKYLPLRKSNGRWALESYAVANGGDGGISLEKLREFAMLCGLEHLFPKLDIRTIVDILNPQTNIALKITPQAMENISERRAAFDLLAAAVLRSERIKCAYKNKKRILEPYKLISQSGVWYLLGAEKGELKLKSFALSKVEEPLLLGEAFAKNAELEKQAESTPTAFVDEKICVVLEIKAEAKEYFLRKRLFEFRELESRGKNMRVECEFGFEDEILNIIKAWIPFIKIISPKSLDKRLRETLKKYLDE